MTSFVASRRRWSSLALVVALAFPGLAFPGLAYAGGTPTLGDVVIHDAPAGYSLAPAGTPNTGEMTIAQFASLAGQKPPKGINDSNFTGYVRRWDDSVSGRFLFVIAARFQDSAEARAFMSGVRKGLVNEGGKQQQTKVPAGLGFTATLSEADLSSVAFPKGRYAFLVEVADRTGTPPQEPVAESVAEQQYAAAPLDNGTQPVDTISVIVGLIILLVLAGGVVALVLLVVRRRRRSRPPWPAAYPAGAHDPNAYPAGTYPAGTSPPPADPPPTYPAPTYPAPTYPAPTYPAPTYAPPPNPPPPSLPPDNPPPPG